jgi:hypothetical protein
MSSDEEEPRESGGSGDPRGERGRLDIETVKSALRELLQEIPAFREFAAGKGKKRGRGPEGDTEGDRPQPQRVRFQAGSGPSGASSSSSPPVGAPLPQGDSAETLGKRSIMSKTGPHVGGSTARHNPQTRGALG